MTETDQEIKQKVEKAQNELFIAILSFYKQHPEKCYTAKNMVEKLGLMAGHNKFFAHAFLVELKKQGKLEKCSGKGEKGYKYAKQSEV